jgi:hypothetical protein
MYSLKIKNGWCAADFTATIQLGGLALQKNHYDLPEPVVEMLEKAVIESEAGSIELQVYITLNLKEVPDSLKEVFKSTYKNTVTQRFRGSNDKDQRPAVTSGELAPILLHKVSPILRSRDFELTSSMTCKLEVEIERQDLCLEILELIGY